MKKQTMLLGVLAVLSAGLASCTPPADDENGKYDGTKYNLRIAAQEEQGEQEILRAFKRSYEASHPDVNLQIESFGGSTLTTYMVKYASNQSRLPHIIWVPDDMFAGFADGGYYVDLRSFYEASPETAYSNYYASMLHNASPYSEFKPLSESTDKKYGLYFAPRDYNKIVVQYNQTLFEEAGIDVPQVTNADCGTDKWNMDSLFALVKKISEKIAATPTMQTYRAIHLFPQWEPVYTTFMKAMGSQLITEDGKLDLTSEKNRQIWDYFYDNYSSVPSAVDAEDSFNQGRIFMNVTVRPASYAPALTLQKASMKTNFLPFPAKDIAAGCSGYAITTAHAEETIDGPKGPKKVKDLAWDFIRYTISEEGQNAFGKLGTGQPILKSLEADGQWRHADAPFDGACNHDAFVAGDELRLLSYARFAPNCRTRLRTIVSSWFQKLESSTEGAKGKRDANMDGIIAEFNRAAKGADL